MPQKIPDRLPTTARGVWRGCRRFQAIGLRRSVAEKPTSLHFSGGPTTHKHTQCVACGRDLTQLWCIDLSDPLIAEETRQTLEPATLLPLLICWNCMAASYRVKSEHEVECFKFDRHTHPLYRDESPFRESPQMLDRVPFAFVRIPSTIDALVSLEIPFDALDDEAVRHLSKYYGRRLTSPWDLPFSQFGGQPLLMQGHQERPCPNRNCPASKLKRPYHERVTDFLMKEMAVLGEDANDELRRECFQVLYYCCIVCGSIRAEYRCS